MKHHLHGGLMVAAAAVAAAAAGTYFFATKKGRKQRVMLQGWAVKAKGEVLERIEKLAEINKEAYDAVVDSVIANYKKVKNADLSALEDLKKELDGYWKGIEHDAKKTVAKTKSAVRKMMS